MSGSPNRNGTLLVHSEQPYNAETPLDRLLSFFTPCADFYVRSHGGIPHINPASHRLRVGGCVRNPFVLGMENLRRDFERRVVAATLQCAGNRRAHMLAVHPVSGEPWAGGAIGNAEWAGARLADVLAAAGAESSDEFHVAFECADKCELDGNRFRYGVSVPFPKAVSREVLLAYEMNGESLAPEHGAPLRVIVPGFAGVRSAKWLSGIRVQPLPSAGPIQSHEYKLFPPDVSKQTADAAQALTINEMPLNSVICEPADGTICTANRIKTRGWAICSAGDIARVEVSADGGQTWTQAQLELHRNAQWCWTLWGADVTLSPGHHELVVRAWDSAGQTQPALVESIWNFKGYLATAWHRIRIHAV